MQLSPAETDAFLAERRTLICATLLADGRPHLTTVWYRWDGASFWISTNADRAKYRNIARDPRVSVLVDAPERETAVSALGHAEVAARGDDAFEGALAIAGRYVDDPRAYLAERQGEPRVLIRIEPEKIVSWTLD